MKKAGIAMAVAALTANVMVVSGARGASASGTPVTATARFTIPSQDNIYAAGLGSPASGQLPQPVAVAPGNVVTVTDATGTWSCNSPFGGPGNQQGPDGNGVTGQNCDPPLQVPATGSAQDGWLSGLTDGSRAQFLTGVFLGASRPSTAPSTLDFTDGTGLGHSFTSLSPQLGQLFFIGDGLTGTGSAPGAGGAIQHFVAPAGAATLYLGYLDGDPTAYNDNQQAISATVSVTSHDVFYSTAPGTGGTTAPDANTLAYDDVPPAVSSFLTNAREPRVSPDGHWLGYLSGGDQQYHNDNLFVIDLTQANPTPEAIVDPGGDYLNGFSFTPDSKSIVYDYGCGIYKADLSNPTPTSPASSTQIDSHMPAGVDSLGQPLYCGDDAPAVSPDGTMVAFHNNDQNYTSDGTTWTSADNGIWVVDVNGANAPQHIANTGLGDVYPQWSPDGKLISYQSSDGNFYDVPPDGSLSPYMLTDASGTFSPIAPWTSDGKYLIAAGTVSGRTAAWSITTDGNETVVALGNTSGANAPAVVSAVLGTVTPGTPTAVTLSATPNPVFVKETTTITATVSPVPDGGTVTFSAGGTAVPGCSSLPVDLATGTAVCQASFSNVSHPFVTGAYTGTQNYVSSSSAPLEVFVAQQPTSASLSVSPTTPVAGSPVTYQATISPVPDGGTVTFTDGGNPIPGCSAVGVETVGGTASCSVSYNTTGSHPITAQYSGDGNYSPATASLTVNVGPPAQQIATSTALSPSPASPVAGQIVVLNATVSPVPDGGTVDFTSGGGNISGCTGIAVDPSKGTASCQTTFANGGASPVQYQLSAIYSGDTLYSGSSGSSTVTVSPSGTGGGGGGGTGTTTVVNPAANPATAGQSDTLTATVSPTPDSGAVNFTDNGNPIPGCSNVTVDTQAGTATCPVTYSTTGTHSIVASYTGSPSYSPSVSPPVALQVVVPTTTGLPAPAGAVSNTPTSLVATVSPKPDGGTVQFSENGSVVGTCGAVPVDVSTGTATCSVTLSAGSHSIDAAFSGTTNYGSSQTSAPTTFNVLSPATLSVQIQPNPAISTIPGTQFPYASFYFVSVTMTAASSPAGGTTPTGTVTLSMGGSPVGACTALTLSGGKATCAFSTAPASTGVFTAQYSGDGTYAQVTSDSQTVSFPQLTSLVLTPSATTASTGEVEKYTAQIFSWGTPDGGTVTFTDGGSPIAGCTSLALSGTSATCEQTYPSAGPHVIAASYTGDANWLGSSAPPTTIGVIPATTTTLVDSGPNDGTAFITLTATVSPHPDGGTVDFVITPPADLFGNVTPFTPDGCGAVPVDSSTGRAVCNYQWPKADFGTYELTAAYSGDTSYGASTSSAVTAALNALVADVTVGIGASNISPYTGNSVTYTASLTTVTQNVQTSLPVGTVTLYDNGTAMPSCTAKPVSWQTTGLLPTYTLLDNTVLQPATETGKVVCSTSYAAAGTHEIQAVYSGAEGGTVPDGSGGSRTAFYSPAATPCCAPGALAVTVSTATASGTLVATTPTGSGYFVATSSGSVVAFGDAVYAGSLAGTKLAAPIVGIVSTLSGKGYWLVASDGGVFAFGDAVFYGSTGGIALSKPIIGMQRTRDGKGYWLFASDGGVFSFGDAVFYGSTGGLHLVSPIISVTVTPDGAGYWMLSADGGVFAYGDAGFYGSEGGVALSKPIVAMTPTADGKGYWLVASDGGVFTFGDATFYGSTGNVALSAPIVGITRTPLGAGYWLVASDGGVFKFGDAGFYGSKAGSTLSSPVVALISSADGKGYWLVTSGQQVYPFGDAPTF